MMGSYLRSGHFSIRLDWDRPHERTEPHGKEETSARDVETSSNYYPIFSSCLLASTAARPPGRPRHCSPLQKASSCLRVLIHGDPKRAELYALMACLEPSNKAIIRTYSDFRAHKFEQKQVVFHDLLSFAFCGWSSHHPNQSNILTSSKWPNSLTWQLTIQKQV